MWIMFSLRRISTDNQGELKHTILGDNSQTQRAQVYAQIDSMTDHGPIAAPIN